MYLSYLYVKSFTLIIFQLSEISITAQRYMIETSCESDFLKHEFEKMNINVSILTTYIFTLTYLISDRKIT